MFWSSALSLVSFISTGITSAIVEARIAKSGPRLLEPPKYLKALQNASVTKRSKVARGRINTITGTAIYAGRQVRDHFFTVDFNGGTVETLTVLQLCARLGSEPLVPKLSHVTCGALSPHSLAACMDSTLRDKLDDLEGPATRWRARYVHTTEEEIIHLGNSLPLPNAGSVFLPWHWPPNIVDSLRDLGCIVHDSCDVDTFAPIRRQSFADAKAAGAPMGVIGLAVDEVADLMLPAACEFAECVAMLEF